MNGNEIVSFDKEVEKGMIQIISAVESITHHPEMDFSRDLAKFLALIKQAVIFIENKTAFPVVTPPTKGTDYESTN